MLLTLLILSRAVAEWVEISQQHYRKPIRVNFNLPAIEKVTEIPQPTKPPRIYTNETLQGPVWSKGNINKVSKLGNVQRVQLDAHSVKAPSLRGSSRNKVNAPSNFAEEENNGVRRTSTVSMQTKHEEYELDSSFEFNIENSPIDFASNSDKFHEDAAVWNTEKNKPKGEVFKKTEIDQKLTSNGEREGNKSTSKDFNTNGPDSSIKPKKEEHLSKGKKNSLQSTTSAIDIFTNIKSISNEKNNQRNVNINKDISKKQDIKVSGSYTTDETNAVKNNPVDNDETIQSEDTNDKENTVNSDDFKSDAIENMIKFVNVVADSIKRNTRRSVSSKTKYLENLKESILANIKEQIDATWPDDDAAPPRRRRAAQAASRGHVQIPSSESALMTISFLTFAVFLIKLVLQVIQTYKNKAMMVAPTVVATVGRVARKHVASP